MSFAGCDSVALQIEDITEIEVTPIPSPFVESESESVELQLIASDLPINFRSETPEQTPRMIEQDIGPFDLRSLSFPSDFTLEVNLELLGGARPGETADLYFLIQNRYGFFRLRTTVEFY